MRKNWRIFVFVTGQDYFTVSVNLLACYGRPRTFFFLHTPDSPGNLVTESRLNLRPPKSRSKLWRRWCNAIWPDLIEAEADRFGASLICVVDVIVFHS